MITNKIYAIIPARSGSKSITDKNIQILQGIPLIAHSILTAKSIPEIDRVMVSTDSVLYKEIAEKYGVEVPFLRPKAISGDDSYDIDWIKHLLGWLLVEEKSLPKYLIHLRPTSPLRDALYISSAINHIRKYPEATALRSVVKMAQPVYKHFEVENGYLKSAKTGSFNLDEANRPRHLYPTSYDANGYVDILKTSHILKTNKIHGNKVLAFYTPYITDIDTIKDLEYARYEREKYV